MASGTETVRRMADAAGERPATVAVVASSIVVIGDWLLQLAADATVPAAVQAAFVTLAVAGVRAWRRHRGAA